MYGRRFSDDVSFGYTAPILNSIPWSRQMSLTTP
jgi:hypothetical protein